MFCWCDVAMSAEVNDYRLNIPIRGTLETSYGSERVVATPSRAAVYRHDQPTTMCGFTGGRWGFTHLGRHASIYRQTYGESPSEALHAHVRRADPNQPMPAVNSPLNATLS